MKKRNRMKTKAKLFILFFIAFVFTGATLCITLMLGNKKEQIADSVSYNENIKITPSICLAENNFLENECSMEQKSYVTALIDKMYINYNYNLNASNYVDYKYKYIIEANIKATEKDSTDKVVYNKTYILKKKVVKVDETSNISINENVPVDFKKYNTTINNFKKDYVLALDSVLTITATIKAEGNYAGVDDNINANNAVSVSLPLSEQTVNINLDNSTYKNKNTIIKINKTPEHNYKVVIARLIYVLDAIQIIIMIIVFFKLKPKQKQYTKMMKRIKKNYDRAIVKVKKIPPLEGTKIIEIDSFEELIDVRDNLEKPILLFENSSKNEALFVILNISESYIYYLEAFGVKK